MADVYKYPEEAFVVSVDFSKVLLSGETIDLQNSAVTSEDSAGEDSTAEIIKPNSTASNSGDLYAVIQAGTAGDAHKLKFSITTSAGAVWIKYLSLKIVSFLLEA